MMNAIDWLKKLISFNTVSRNSNLKLIEMLQDTFQAHGITTRITTRSDQKKANCFAIIPAKNGDLSGGLILSGHTDVVPVDGQTWETDPFKAEIKDDRLYGRGACDMKGFLAIILALVPAIKKWGLNYPLYLAFSYDEEVGLKGAPFLIADFIQNNIRPKACIVGEPTHLYPILAHKGIQLFQIKVKGVAAHSSLIEEGCNAIFYAAKVITQIEKIAENMQQHGPFDPQFDVPYSTLSVNKIEGGTANNIIPSLCEFYLELRYLPQIKPEEIMQRIRNIIQDEGMRMKQEKQDANIQMDYLAGAPSFKADKEQTLIQLICKMTKKTPYKVAYATEAGLFQQADIPTIIWGPGSIREAHKPNEYIELSQLKQYEEYLVQVLKALQF